VVDKFCEVTIGSILHENVGGLLCLVLLLDNLFNLNTNYLDDVGVAEFEESGFVEEFDTGFSILIGKDLHRKLFLGIRICLGKINLEFGLI